MNGDRNPFSEGARSPLFVHICDKG